MADVRYSLREKAYGIQQIICVQNGLWEKIVFEQITNVQYDLQAGILKKIA